MLTVEGDTGNPMTDSSQSIPVLC